MPARRIDSAGAGNDPVDDPALASAAAADAEPGEDAVARHRERQKDRLTLVSRDPVALRADPFDHEVDRVGWRRIPGAGAVGVLFDSQFGPTAITKPHP